LKYSYLNTTHPTTPQISESARLGSNRFHLPGQPHLPFLLGIFSITLRGIFDSRDRYKIGDLV
jgi:hypothetical protein